MKTVLNALKKYFKKLDKLLLLTVSMCTVLGIVLLYSLFINESVSASYYKTQLLSMGVGLILCLIIAAIDYKHIAKLWFLYAPLALIPVGLTFTSLGIGVNGSDDIAWLRLGPVTFQPAEILKIAFLLSFSYHLDKIKDDMNNIINLSLICFHAAIPIGLVMKQGDDGTAIVFMMMFAIMLYSAGISFGYILIAIAAVPVVLYFAWKYLLGDFQKSRILVLLYPGTDPEGIEWQQNLGISDLSSGSIFGNGIINSEKNINPEIHNDFIFSYVGYTLGFVGCVGLIAMLTYICIKIIANSRNTREELGKNICVGAFAMYFTHCVLNIGMVLKVMPVIGIPLPFVSAGGTALVSMYIILGLVLSVREHNEKIYRMFA